MTKVISAILNSSQGSTTGAWASGIRQEFVALAVAIPPPSCLW
jgi:hypothetical protein